MVIRNKLPQNYLTNLALAQWYALKGMSFTCQWIFTYNSLDSHACLVDLSANYVMGSKLIISINFKIKQFTKHKNQTFDSTSLRRMF